MAIKPIDNIPDAAPAPPSQRELIRRDVREAYENHISQFEFEDDRYKYDTLINNARDALKQWFHREVYFLADKKAKERLKDKISGYFWTPMAYEYDTKAYSLSKRKLDDRVHVYCTLNFDLLDHLEQTIYDDTFEKYSKNWPEQIIGGA